MPDLTNETFIEAIEKQFQFVLNSLHAEDKAQEIKAVKVYNEQVFKSLPNEALNKRTVFIVVRFGKGTVNYGAAALPVDLVVFGFPNSIDSTQLLLLTFSSTWTTYQLLDPTVTESTDAAPFPTSTQVWQTPNVFSNFNEIGDHFRSTFSLSGVVILGTNTVNINTIEYYENADLSGDPETMQCMMIDDTYNASLSPQPFGHTDGFAISEVNFSTNNLSFSMYLLDTQFLADVMKVKGLRQSRTDSDAKTSSKSGRNDCFYIIIRYSNGFTNAPADLSNITDLEKINYSWKMVRCEISQPLGDITKLSVSFAH